MGLKLKRPVMRAMHSDIVARELLLHVHGNTTAVENAVMQSLTVR